MLIAYPARALVCTVSALICSTTYAQDLSRVLDFSVAPNRLSSAIIEFSQQSGIQIVTAGEDVSRLSTPGVSGRLAISQALDALLTGTELRFEVIGESTVAFVSRSLPMTQTRGGSEHKFERIAAADERGLTNDETQSPGQRGASQPSNRGADAVEEVVVNAYRPASAIGGSTKTNTPLIETPQSVSVVTRDELDARDVQNLNEAVRYNAGVLAESQGIDNRVNDIYIRGFDAGSWNNNLTLDGLRLVQGMMWNRLMIDNWNLESVEVLKGPSAVLYGQVAPGGLVNQVSKVPAIDQKQQVRLSVDGKGRYQMGFDLGDAVGEESTALWRLVGLYSDGDTQIDHTEQSHWFLAPSATFRWGERTRLTLLGLYQEDSGGSTFQFLPYQGTVTPSEFGFIKNTTFVGEPNWNTYDRTIWSAGWMFQHDFGNGWKLNQNARRMHIDSLYQTTVGGDAVLAGGRMLARRAVQGVGDSNGYTIDTRIEGKFSTGRVDHTVLVGVDWLQTKEEGLREAARVNANVIAIDVFNPVYTNFDFPSVLFPQISSDDKIRQTGMYLQDQIALDRWRFTLSARNDWADNRLLNRLTNTPTIIEDEAFTGRAGALYLFDNGVAPYVSYAQSFQPSTSSSTLSFTNTPFDSVTGSQWEVGVKFQPASYDGLLMFSAYELRQENILTPDPVASHDCGAGPNSCLVQTGEVRVRGLELEGRITPVTGLSIIGSVTRMDSEIVQSNLGDQGNEMIRVPDVMGSLWVDYTFSSGAFDGVSVAGGARYVGETFGDTANTLSIPSYSLVDLALRSSLARIGFPRAQVTLNASNLADKRYVASCTALTSCFYGTGRTITGSVRVNW